MLQKGFQIDLINTYAKLMTSSEWIELTLLQLEKDLTMAGFKSPSLLPAENLSSSVDRVMAVISEAKCNKELWDNLNYRIDLPEALDISGLSDHDVAELYLMRSFQKVWLRKQFSS